MSDKVSPCQDNHLRCDQAVTDGWQFWLGVTRLWGAGVDETPSVPGPWHSHQPLMTDEAGERKIRSGPSKDHLSILISIILVIDVETEKCKKQNLLYINDILCSPIFGDKSGQLQNNEKRSSKNFNRIWTYPSACWSKLKSKLSPCTCLDAYCYWMTNHQSCVWT